MGRGAGRDVVREGFCFFDGLGGGEDALDAGPGLLPDGEDAGELAMPKSRAAAAGFQ